MIKISEILNTKESSAMSWVPRLFRRKRELAPNDMVKPYCWYAKQALLSNELPKAVAYLSCGIRLAPEELNLYLQRAQIFQYGLENFSAALEDYRHILRQLESKPDPSLATKCRQAMRDMMS